MSKTKTINKALRWKSKTVKVSDVLPTPNNYKIQSDLGLQALQTSLSKFGLAGTAVVNPIKGGKYVLIDGNSRRKEAIKDKQTTMEVSIPSRPLTPKEFEEMSAMFDYAKASSVDTERIKGEIGKTLDFYKQWGMDPPDDLLKTMGKAAIAKGLEFPGTGGRTTKDRKELAAEMEKHIVTVSLFFSAKEASEFEKITDKLGKMYKLPDVTHIVLKALKSIK